MIYPGFEEVEIFVLNDKNIMTKRTVWRYGEIYICDILHDGVKHFMLGCAPLGLCFPIQVTGVFAQASDACEAAKEIARSRNTWTDIVEFTDQIRMDLYNICTKHNSVPAKSVGSPGRDVRIINGNPTDYY